MLETYHGGCHCGRVRFRIRADLGTIGECNCSICTKKGILHLPVPLDRFKLLCGGGAHDLSVQYRNGTAHLLPPLRHSRLLRAALRPRSDQRQRALSRRIDVSVLKPSRFFDGRNWEAVFAMRQTGDGLGCGGPTFTEARVNE